MLQGMSVILGISCNSKLSQEFHEATNFAWNFMQSLNFLWISMLCMLYNITQPKPMNFVGEITRESKQQEQDGKTHPNLFFTF